MKKVLLTGAHGFLGSHLKRSLRSEGFFVKTVARSKDPWDASPPDFQIDISDREAWKKIDFKPDAVVHAAACLPSENSFELSYLQRLLQIQIIATHHLCEWIASQDSIHSILNISSLAVFEKPWPHPLTEGSPLGPNGRHALYGLSKLGQETLISSFPFGRPMRVGHARLSSLFGEGMSWSGVLCKLVDSAVDGKNLELTNGDSVFADFLYGRDAARMLVNLVRAEAEGIVLLGSGIEISLRQCAQAILSTMNATHLEILNREMGMKPQHALVDISRYKTLTGDGTVTPLSDALQSLINWRLLTRGNSAA